MNSLPDQPPRTRPEVAGPSFGKADVERWRSELRDFLERTRATVNEMVAEFEHAHPAQSDPARRPPEWER